MWAAKGDPGFSTRPCPRLLHSWQRGSGQRTAAALSETIHSLAEASAGAANFRFAVAFNCPPGIPYFPAAAAAEGTSGFALGTENSGLLHAAFQQAAAEAAAAAGATNGSNNSSSRSNGSGGGGDHSVLDVAQASLARLMTAQLQPLEALARQLAADSGVSYLGIDASIAPALEPPSLADAYESLGLGRFGGAGTLAVSGAPAGGGGVGSAPGRRGAGRSAWCGCACSSDERGSAQGYAALKCHPDASRRIAMPAEIHFPPPASTCLPPTTFPCPLPAERITAALKSLPLQLCGYSGLMLPVCEDSGLAAAANDGRIGIGSLLHFSGGGGVGVVVLDRPKGGLFLNVALSKGRLWPACCHF